MEGENKESEQDLSEMQDQIRDDDESDGLDILGMMGGDHDQMTELLNEWNNHSLKYKN